MLTWTAPGNDGDQGWAAQYFFRYSTTPDSAASWWELATEIANRAKPKRAGSPESLKVGGLAPSTPYYFAMKAVDQAGNLSLMSNAASCTTALPPDFVAPAPILDLRAGWARAYTIDLRWTATGDDGTAGTASSYDVRYSTQVPEDDGWWESATRVPVTQRPKPSGESEFITVTGLTPETTYYLAIKAADDVSNWSEISNFTYARTLRRTYPQLTVSSSLFGTRAWMGWTYDTEVYEVPFGSSFDLTMLGDAAWYDGAITGYSFAWDLENLVSPVTDPEGKGAWTPWDVERTIVHARFDKLQDRFLYMKCRDDGGSTTLATIHFRVVSFGAVKNLGYVDDWRLYPRHGTNSEMNDDSAWQMMLDGYDYGWGWDACSWDEWDAPEGEEIPSLEWLSQFRVIVWSINDNRMIPADSKSAWYNMGVPGTDHVLALYLASDVWEGEKGKLWIYGKSLIESAVMPYGGPFCEYPYGVDSGASLASCKIRPRSFAYDFMHLRGDFDRNDPNGGGTRVNFFSNWGDQFRYIYLNPDSLPIEGYDAPPATELYPSLPRRLDVDLGKWRAENMRWCEVLDYPDPESNVQLTFFDPGAERPTGLVPLYRQRAASPTSHGEGRYCGFRYIPTYDEDHGELVYFFFHMYPILSDQSRAMTNVILTDWFGLPYPEAAGR
jgi:hypothetical protein